MSFVLAGLLQGVGQGIQKQGAEKAAAEQAQRDNDFQVALENLRSANDRTNAANTASLNDENTRKEYGYKNDFEEKQLPRRIAEARADGEIRKDVDNNATANNIRSAQVQGAITRQNDAASQKLAKDLESGDIADTFLDESGEYVGITRTGKQVRTGVRANAVDTTIKSGSSGGSSLFPELAETPAVQAAAAPAPRAPAPKPAAQGGKIMTQADIDATAKARNLSKPAAKLLLEELGFRLKS